MSNHLVETSVVDEATRTNTERWRATTWSAMLDLAAWVQERRDEIRSGECALQLSPTVIEVMGKYFRNELEPPQPKRLSLFRKKTAGMNPSDVITTLMEATQRASHVIVEGEPSSVYDTTTEWRVLDFEDFTSITTLELRALSVREITGVSQLFEFIALQCNLPKASSFWSSCLGYVRTIRFEDCTLCWDDVGSVASTVRTLSAVGSMATDQFYLPHLDAAAETDRSSTTALPWECLTDLNVSNNGIPKLDIDSCHRLINLTQLVLSHNALDSVAALQGCHCLRYLDLSHNKLTSFKDVCPYVQHVCELNVSNNEIESFDGLEHARLVQSLDITANKLVTVHNIDVILLTHCESLNAVWVHGNPIFDKVDDICNFCRVAFHARSRISLDGVMYGPLPHETIQDIRRKYFTLWRPLALIKDPSLTSTTAMDAYAGGADHVIEFEDTGLRRLDVVDVLSTSPSRSSACGSLGRAGSLLSPKQELLDGIEKEKRELGTSWLEVARTNESPRSTEGPTKRHQVNDGDDDNGPKKTTTKRVVKRVVRRSIILKKEKDSEAEHPIEATPPSISHEPEKEVVEPQKVEPPFDLENVEHTQVSAVTAEDDDPAAHPRLCSPSPRPHSPTPAVTATRRLSEDPAYDDDNDNQRKNKDTRFVELFENHLFVSGPVTCTTFPMPTRRHRQHAGGCGGVWLDSNNNTNNSAEGFANNVPEIHIRHPDSVDLDGELTPSHPTRYRGRCLLKLVLASTSHGMGYITLKQRCPHDWETDVSVEEGRQRPSEFDRTYFTVAGDYDVASFTDDFSAPSADIVFANIDVDSGVTPSRRATFKSFESEVFPMNGKYVMNPMDADAVREDVISFVSAPYILCGFVVEDEALAREVAGFIKAQLRIVLHTLHVSHATDSLHRVCFDSFEDSAPEEALQKALDSGTKLRLDEMRRGAVTPVTSDEVELHLKKSVFGIAPKSSVLEAYGVVH
eukprot:PhM_4_TR1267/c0_g1_i5/m.31704